MVPKTKIMLCAEYVGIEYVGIEYVGTEYDNSGRFHGTWCMCTVAPIHRIRKYFCLASKIEIMLCTKSVGTGHDYLFSPVPWYMVHV